MEFLQNIDGGTLTLLGLGCISLCGIFFLLFFGLQVIGQGIAVFSGVFELVMNVIGGGPVSWCGCLVMFLACGLCGVVAFSLFGILQTCGTEEQVMFCRLFGY